MILLKPSFEILNQSPGIDGLMKHIERCARVAYQSQDQITDESAPKFVDMLINRGHGACLEHGTIYLHVPDLGNWETMRYAEFKYGIFNQIGGEYFVTTNYRELVETNNLKALRFQCEPTEYHEKRISVKFNTQIAISREFNRHRINSIVESSTRYCNYSKDKFGNQISISIPNCVTQKEIDNSKKAASRIIGEDSNGDSFLFEIYPDDWNAIDWWIWANSCSELAYMKLIELGWRAQDARTILPLDTNTELVHTASESQWYHFFELRCPNTAHPSARALAIPLLEEFKKINPELFNKLKY